MASRCAQKSLATLQKLDPQKSKWHLAPQVEGCLVTGGLPVRPVNRKPPGPRPGNLTLTILGNRRNHLSGSDRVHNRAPSTSLLSP